MKEIKDNNGTVIGITNEVMINDIELASELAHNATLREMGYNPDDDLALANATNIYVVDENGDTTYTDEAQDIFNDWYDYYSTKIESVATVPIPTEVDYRVYGVDISDIEEIISKISNERWIDIAEQQGNVWTLAGFQEQLNSDDINISTLVIRILKVVVGGSMKKQRVTVGEVVDAWERLYGENFKKEYSGVYKELNKIASVEEPCLCEKYEELKAEFEQYQRESVKWGVDDMKGHAVEIGYVLTDEQAQDALEEMVRKHDCTIGITWDTVDYYVCEYGTKKVDDGTLVEVTEEQAIEYFNKGVEIWVEDEEETKNEETGKYERLKTVYSKAEGDEVDDIMGRDTRLLVDKMHI